MLYLFEINGKEKVLKIDNGILNLEGNYTYPIQNYLKIGYSYILRVEEGIIINARERKILSE